MRWVRGWLAKARDDLQAGGVLLEATLPSYGPVSFFAQQVAEKALKALLVHVEVPFERTHNLEELLQLAEPATPGILAELIECRELTPYAVDTRYPGGPVIGPADAARHLALARRVVENVERRLGPLATGPSET